MALKVPIFIVISKVDLCTRATVERTVRQLERVLKQPGCNKVPMVVGSTDDAVTAAQQFAQSPKYVCVTTKPNEHEHEPCIVFGCIHTEHLLKESRNLKRPPVLTNVMVLFRCT